MKIEKFDGHVLKQGAWHDDQMTNDVGKAMFAKAGEQTSNLAKQMCHYLSLVWISFCSNDRGEPAVTYKWTGWV